MPRLPGRKAVPWMLLLEAAMVMRTHWGHLDDHDRRELARIVRKSHGRPGNLTKNERSELARIMRRLDLITAGRKLMPFHGGVRRSRR
ncbi:MAG TPA: hypothetical protein VNT03_14315 [Baekduia sp.]|nr:hypothetical protein [Baekduia sp.]